MNNLTLQQVMDAARALTLEDQRRLRRWLEQQEDRTTAARQRRDRLRAEEERFRKALRWLDEHRAEYLGQWVALDGDRLISHGTDGVLVHAQAKAAGIASPLLEHSVEDNEPFGAVENCVRQFQSDLPAHVVYSSLFFHF